VRRKVYAESNGALRSIPRVVGDEATYRRVELELGESVAVTDVPW
jgi:hypothetical protein